jgi:pilus assembly protein Flp/PilA
MRPGINKLIHQLKCLLKLDHGQDMVEYALVVALIAFGTTAAMSNLATGFQNFFTKINASVTIV